MATNELILLIDTSQSILLPGSLSALQEILEKIYSDLIYDPIEQYFDTLTIYQCGDNATRLVGHEKWLPIESDCRGIAPISDALNGMILSALRKSRSSNRLLAVLSDGYWCGQHTKVTEFEFTCYAEKLATIVEINVLNLNAWNLNHPRNIHIFSTDDNATKKLLDAAKQTW